MKKKMCRKVYLGDRTVVTKLCSTYWRRRDLHSQEAPWGCSPLRLQGCLVQREGLRLRSAGWQPLSQSRVLVLPQTASRPRWAHFCSLSLSSCFLPPALRLPSMPVAQLLFNINFKAHLRGPNSLQFGLIL